MLALSIFATLLVLAMAVNVGTVVNDRVRMQVTADLATYAVAYSEAAALNDVSSKNEEIADIIKQCRRDLENGPFAGSWNTNPCSILPTDPLADRIVDRCKMQVDQAIVEFTQAARWDATVEPALRAGENTADANFSGVDVTFFDDVVGSPTRRGTFRTTYATNSMGARGTFESIANFTQVTDVYLNYSVIVENPTTCTPLPVPVPSWPTSLKAWFYKDTNEPDLWVAGRVSGTPARPFMDTDYSSFGRDRGYFGSSSTGGDDELVAYAVAKPYDGSVGPSNVAWLQRTGNIPGPHPLGVFDNQSIWFPKFTMVQEYRARLAGINDDLAGSTTPAELIRRDGGSFGGWDMSKFHH